MAVAFDFVIVGAGPSGCVVASRLARSPAKPTVLLLEAGGTNETTEHLSSDERFNVAFSPNSPLNWNYKTTPQNQLSGQEIDYSRGKGLGGSTAINFCGWTVGSRDDYEEWAHLVGDESFNWLNAKRHLDQIQNVHPEIPVPALDEYVAADVQEHSTSGAVDLSYGDTWVPDVGDVFVAAEQIGVPMNRDVNSGNPIGMGMASVCIHKGKRVTAANAYLSCKQPNLTIVTDALVAKVLFEGRRAIGVKLNDGRDFLARKEVVLSGGALNTPQILLLSGVGPAYELERHDIPVIFDLPNVGENLQDHCFAPVGITLKQRLHGPNDQAQSPSPMGWFKLPEVLSSPECRLLPQGTQEFLFKSTVPSYELCTHTPPSFLSYTAEPGVSFLGAISMVMNPQSRGTVTIQSRDPSVAPVINPRFLSHAFDRRVITEAMRQTMRLLAAPVYARGTIAKFGPFGGTDEEIWEHVKKNLASSWHMSCTVRMGKDSSSACVDSEFGVFGIDGLRVADLSVCPFVPK
ncbi:glucose-methanol-choline oxidoreductase protein [Venturia nashicola]|nr:glucose-methanol-choline oxidoreductase protein [Venturia nashicola]